MAAQPKNPTGIFEGTMINCKAYHTVFSEERKWRQWVDNDLVHVLSPNVYRSLEESLESFRWFSTAGNWEENFPKWERLMVIYVGALAMYFISKRLKKRSVGKWEWEWPQKNFHIPQIWKKMEKF
jgi:hypothetical protein